MKNFFNKVQYVFMALGFISALLSLLVGAHVYGKWDSMTIGCLGWIVCAFIYMRENDRHEKRIKELNDEIDEMLTKLKK